MVNILISFHLCFIYIYLYIYIYIYIYIYLCQIPDILKSSHQESQQIITCHEDTYPEICAFPSRWYVMLLGHYDWRDV